MPAWTLDANANTVEEMRAEGSAANAAVPSMVKSGPAIALRK
jgi:hypothetical protein